MNRRLRLDYVEWLDRYRWRWFGVFTCRAGIRMKSARRKFSQWMHDVELAEGRKLSWIAFPERSENAIHFHVLIAGIHSRIYAHMRHWITLAGTCHVVRFTREVPRREGMAISPGQPGIDYVVKGMRNDDYDFDAHLSDAHLRPRFRKQVADDEVGR